MNTYVELKCKSNFSFLRGASDARDYVRRAQELGIAAIGITDVNGVYGLPRAYEVLRDFPGVKLISGAEITLKDHPPITLLARDRAAYGVLCRLITRAHASVGQKQASTSQKETPFLTLDELSEFTSLSETKGLVAIPDLTAQTPLDFLKDHFDDRLYLPLTRALDGMDAQRTRRAIEAARQYGLRIVATNDVHYHVPERRPLQDCLTCIREGTDLRHAGFKLFGNDERYLKSPLQMATLFRDLPDALQATLDVAESCTFSLKELKYIYPIEWIPEGHTSQSYFESLVWAGAHEEYPSGIPEAVASTIEKEFKLIRKLDYSSYFLTIHDIVRFARSKNILCQGRGSAANSVCCYFLGITAVNPVEMNLLFERFLNEHRAEPPDIDVDFEHERREEVIQWIYDRYGRERAGMVAAVRTYQRRSSFLELSKAVGIPVGTISASELAEDFEKHAGTDADKREQIERLSQELEDFPRHLSIHSGGFTLSQNPLTETVPIQPARMENRTIVQWDKNDLDTVGLLKIDVLSLGFLTALHKVCDLVSLTLGRPFHWREIPPDDAATYDMICRAETEGTFQIESRAQRSMLTRTRPRTFYDLVVQVAIVRPGPNVGEMIHPYIKRKEAERRGIPYRLNDPILERILGRTYGVPIFQEQIMQLAIEKAGFSPGEADQLRRSLGLIRAAGDVQRVSQRLRQGLIDNGVSETYADELLGYVKGYSHYGFPESHAASFASISYKSAYLKRHYPAEFLCGLINSQPMGFYPVDTLVNAAKREGVKVLPIHPQFSDWDAKLENSGVRMGFRNVRGLSHEAFAACERERARKPFADLLDFVQRSRFSREVIEALSLADAFACFGLDQRHTLWEAIEHQTLFDRHEQAQLPLFTHEEAVAKAPSRLDHVPLFSSMTLYESMMAQYRAMGYSIHGNLMRGLRAENPKLPRATSETLRRALNGRTLTLSGIMMVIQRPPTAKGTCFLTLEDEFGSIDAVLSSEVFERDRNTISNHRILQLTGRVQVAGTAHTLRVSRVSAPPLTHSIRGKNVYHGMHPRELKMDFEG